MQLPYTFHSKSPNGKKDALKVTAPQSKHYKQKAKRTVSSKKQMLEENHLQVREVNYLIIKIMDRVNLS